MTVIQIRPLDQVVARDGRPFGSGAGNRMRCLDWPYPSVSAGTIRTLLGKLHAGAGGADPFSDPTFLARLRAVAVHGPLACREEDGALRYQAPLDLLLVERDGEVVAEPLVPHALGAGEGTNLQVPILLASPPEEARPAAAPAFWSAGAMDAWLRGETPEGIESWRSRKEDFAGPLERDVRVHVSVDPVTSTAEDEKLFSTEGLALPPGWAIACRVETADQELAGRFEGLRTVHQFGGERRQSQVKAVEKAETWLCSAALAGLLQDAGGVRMILATPALFAGGWLPGWLDDESLEGTPPGAKDSGLRLRLRGAVTGRWKPISGWSLEPLAETGSPGPKPVRRLVPAGSTYFFEVADGDPSALSDLWLRPVADAEQDRRDGFGLALWGVWSQ